MALKETRKKIQRSVLFMASCPNTKSALHELTLLKNTVDSMIKLLADRLNSSEENDGKTISQKHSENNYYREEPKEADSKTIYKNKILYG